MGKIAADSKAELQVSLKDGAKMAAFVTKLIVQGLLMLLEDEVKVRCRESDDAVVSGCLSAAASEYAKVLKTEAGATKSVKLTLDKENKLPAAPGGGHGASCLGGVVLACHSDKITIDNTIDSRLGLVMEQSKPMIRKLLFGN